MDEGVIRERVAGLSGLGLAEEQRVRRAMQTILLSTTTATPTTTTEQLQAAVDQLRVQAARLRVTIHRHLTDHQILLRDIDGLKGEAELTERNCELLVAEREEWVVRNGLFEEYEAVCKQILAVGPPVCSVEQEIRLIGEQIENLKEKIATEDAGYEAEVKRIADLVHQLKSV